MAVEDWRSTLTVLLHGRFVVSIDGEETVLERPGDYVIWLLSPDRWHTWRAPADSVMVPVRWPSVLAAEKR